MCMCVCVCVVLMRAHRFSVVLFCNKVIKHVCVYMFVDAQFSTILFYKVCTYERSCVRMCLYVSVSMSVYVHE